MNRLTSGFLFLMTLSAFVSSCAKKDDGASNLSNRLEAMTAAGNFYEASASSYNSDCYVVAVTDTTKTRMRITGHVQNSGRCVLDTGETMTFSCADDMTCSNSYVYGDATASFKYSVILLSEKAFTLVVKKKFKDDPTEYTREIGYSRSY